jgi:hypothetical protein
MEEPHNPDDALDALLQGARFPEPSIESQARLRDRWVGLSRERRMQRAAAIVSAAAVVILALGIGWALSRRDQHHVTPKYVVVMPDVRATGPVQSRPANLWERAVVQRATPRREVATAQPAPRPTEIVDVNSILDRVADPKARAEALKKLRVMSDPPVNQLLVELRNPLMQKRFAAARALGALPAPKVVPGLRQMLQRDDTRRDALAALMCCDDPTARQILQHARQSRSIDAQCLALQTQINPGL